MQLVIPENKKKKPEVITKTMRESLQIKPSEKSAHAQDVQGYYRLTSGEIFIGTFEEFTSEVLWHEQIHKILNESLDLINPLKATIQWDNIARDLAKFLFGYEGLDTHEVKINYAEAKRLYDNPQKYIDLLRKMHITKEKIKTKDLPKPNKKLLRELSAYKKIQLKALGEI